MLWIKNLRSVSGEKVSPEPLAGLTDLALGETPYESLKSLYPLKSLNTIYISNLANDLKKIDRPHAVAQSVRLT
ncbi:MULTISPECIES: hypothetical protein [Leptospira]|uniref:Leucine rich repeat protein n=3 Tax=Leptospira weilii TaxID=28184 RepID=A0A828Z2J9_9LEPT|nr:MULTISPECIES: hypothetical protein [Leptospira]EKR64586.1 hypothetical protein LEP1GSC036_3299 [Leptospira weilii str. 2006001853]EMJ67155.1 hypothetical protein LEP1GSC051_3764 [Leptospira sp. P2653]EMN43693.1 hypothetical protein LEP1GSC086_3554 [Leptospira weilii str. LNT 1234]EMN89326.1 hypothetical protein LEP1GSC108_4464 [Leptospira weilii str. UI 13098]MCL8268452.1 hypothetical protein [Leptospira weilii]